MEHTKNIFTLMASLFLWGYCSVSQGDKLKSVYNVL